MVCISNIGMKLTQMLNTDVQSLIIASYCLVILLIFEVDHPNIIVTVCQIRMFLLVVDKDTESLLKVLKGFVAFSELLVDCSHIIVGPSNFWVMLTQEL